MYRWQNRKEEHLLSLYKKIKCGLCVMWQIRTHTADLTDSTCAFYFPCCLCCLHLNPASTSAVSLSSLLCTARGHAVSDLHLREATTVKDGRSASWAVSLHLVLDYSDSCWLRSGTAAPKQRVSVCVCVFVHSFILCLHTWNTRSRKYSTLILPVYQSSHILSKNIHSAVHSMINVTALNKGETRVRINK